MVNYQDGKIYKLVCNTTGLIYIGSTCENLSKRLAHHIYQYKTKLNATQSYRIFENNNYDLILIEKFPCNDRIELLQRERFHIDNNECVNIGKPISTPEERQQKKERNRECVKLNYQKNREHYLEKIVCVCGITHTFSNRKSHSLSLNHENRMKDVIASQATHYHTLNL
jgi:hypothetical protein